MMKSMENGIGIFGRSDSAFGRQLDRESADIGSLPLTGDWRSAAGKDVSELLIEYSFRADGSGLERIIDQDQYSVVENLPFSWSAEQRRLNITYNDDPSTTISMGYKLRSGTCVLCDLDSSTDQLILHRSDVTA